MTLLFTLDRIERFLGLVEDESAQRFSFLKFKLQSIRINNRTSRTIDWILYNVSLVLRDDCKFCIESFTHKDKRPISGLRPIVWNIFDEDEAIVKAFISSNPTNYSFTVKDSWEHLKMDITIVTEDRSEIVIRLVCPDPNGWFSCFYNATGGDDFREK